MLLGAFYKQCKNYREILFTPLVGNLPPSLSRLEKSVGKNLHFATWFFV